MFRYSWRLQRSMHLQRSSQWTSLSPPAHSSVWADLRWPSVPPLDAPILVRFQTPEDHRLPSKEMNHQQPYQTQTIAPFISKERRKRWRIWIGSWMWPSHRLKGVGRGIGCTLSCWSSGTDITGRAESFLRLLSLKCCWCWSWWRISFQRCFPWCGDLPSRLWGCKNACIVLGLSFSGPRIWWSYLGLRLPECWLWWGCSPNPKLVAWRARILHL